MDSDRSDEELLVKYLLGHSTEEEQVQVEDRAFADTAYLTALEAVEADLIDAYVRGGLSQPERRGFERRFLASPTRRSKVEFARALARVTAESKTVEAASPSRPFAWKALVDIFRGWSAALRFATAVAATVCITGVSFLVVQNTMMRSWLTALEQQRRELELRQKALQRELTAQSQKQTAPLSTAAPAPTPVVAALVLMPGLARGEAHREQLSLDASTQVAHIEIQLESRDDYPRFRAELRTRRGEEVITQSNLRRKAAGGGHSVFVDVPTSILVAGEYELALKGILNDQTVQDVGYYYFAVAKH